VIQGDGINEDSIRGILMNLKFAGYSADNCAFGMGGALLQHMNRDTQQWAMKCSWAQVNGQSVDVFKDPVGDTSKKSKKGRITLVKDRDNYMTIAEKDLKVYEETSNWREALIPVFENGNLLKDWTLTEIRENSRV
jgi:nicotinamide phosphoribosyltransferase